MAQRYPALLATLEEASAQKAERAGTLKLRFIDAVLSRYCRKALRSKRAAFGGKRAGVPACSCSPRPALELPTLPDARIKAEGVDAVVCVDLVLDATCTYETLKF